MTRPAPLQQWPPGESEMAQRMRAYDWSATPLGSMAAWPDALTRAVAAAMLSSDVATGHDASPAPLTTDAVNAFLVRFSDAVLQTIDPQEVAQTACQLVSDTLGVERAYWAEVDWTTREYVIGAAVHQPGVPVISGRFPVESWEPFTAYHLAGRSVVVDDTQADERISPEMRAAYAQIAVGADLATPIVVNGRLRGTLTVNQQHPRHWTEEEVTLVRGIARRCWAAVDQARAETALRSSEARYRALATASSDVIYHMGADWREMRQLDGRGILADTADPSETWLATYILPEDQPQVAATIAEAVRTGTPFELDHRVRHADGSIGWTHSRAVPLHDALGRVVEWVGTATDITAQRQADEHLRQSEARYRALFAAMDEGYCRYQIIAGDDGAPQDALILEANAAYERLMQRPSPVGKRLREVEPHLDQEWLNALVDVANAGAPRRFERYNPRLDRWFDVQVTPAPGAGLEIVLVFADITERRHSEEAQRRNAAWNRAQNRAFQAAMDGAPLAQALAILADLVRAETGGEARTAFYLADVIGTHLHPVRGAGTMPDAYLDAVDGFRIGEDALACWLDVPTGQPVITPDIQTEPRWVPWVAMAQAFGYRGCWSFPIKTRDRQTVGTFAMYFETTREASATDLALAEAVTQAAAVIIASTSEAAERARAEAALRESEERYRLLFSSVTEGFCTIEVIFTPGGVIQDMIIRDVNPAFYTQSGMTDVIGRAVSEVLPNFEAYWFEQYAQVAQTGEAIQYENYVQDVDRWFSLSFFRIGEADSRLVGVVFADVSARKRAEAALRESEERQAFLLRLSDALRPFADAMTIARAALELLRAHFGVPRTLYAEALDQDGAMRIVAESLVPGLQPMEGLDFHFGDFTSDALAQVRAGRPLWREDVQRDDHNPAQQAGYAALGSRSWAMIPLVKDGRFVANLTVYAAEAREWTPDEIALLQEVAERTWAAVERVRAEAALRVSEARYRTLFETMGQGYCDLELMRDASGRAVDQRYLAFNPAFERLFGIPVDAATGRTASEVFPELEPWWHDAFDRIAQRGEPERIEYAVASLDRWFEVFAYPIGGDRLTVLYEDITTRRQAEEAVRASEERQAFLLQLSDVVRPLEDAAEIMATVSERVGRYFDAGRCGYAEVPPPYDRLVIVRDWTDGVMDSRQGSWPLASFGERVIAEYRNGQTVVYEDIFDDDRTRGYEAGAAAAGMVRSSISVPLLKGGEWVACFYVQNTTVRHWTPGEIELMEDIAERTWATLERTRAEAMLQERETRFRTFAEYATDTLWIVDAERGQLEYLSPAFEQMWGESRDAVMGNLDRWVDLVHPADRERASQAMRRVVTGEVSHLVNEYRIVRPADGAIRWIYDTGFAIQDVAGAVTRVGGIAQDITDRKLAETALQEREARYREDLEAEVTAATLDLHAVSRRLLLVQEEERHKLALELHDEIGQVLTGLTFQLAAAQRSTEGTALSEANTTVQRLTEQVRQLALDLRPQVLDRYGLLAAVRWYVDRYEATTSITVHLREQDVAQRRYPPEIEIAAFRVVQEALTNIARYAGVNEAWVTLFSDGVLLLVIHDEGHGFDPATPRASSGLDGMRERVALLGGTFALETTPGEGVQITAEFPLQMRDPAAREVSS